MERIHFTIRPTFSSAVKLRHLRSLYQLSPLCPNPVSLPPVFYVSSVEEKTYLHIDNTAPVV